MPPSLPQLPVSYSDLGPGSAQPLHKASPNAPVLPRRVTVQPTYQTEYHSPRARPRAQTPAQVSASIELLSTWVQKEPVAHLSQQREENNSLITLTKIPELKFIIVTSRLHLSSQEIHCVFLTFVLRAGLTPRQCVLQRQTVRKVCLQRVTVR